MTNVVMFSGGLSSAVSALWLKLNKPNERLILLFTDTLIEDADLYRFVDETVAFLKPDEYIYLADGRDPWEVFKDERYLGNSRVDPCSKILKRQLANNYIKQRFTPEECVLWFGIHWSEEERLTTVQQRLAPYKCASVLTDPSKLFIDAKDIRGYWEQHTNIRVPRLYDLGFKHNNCGGFCVKAGKGQFKRLFEAFPETFDYHAQKEQELQEYLGKEYTILREQRNGTRYRLSLKEYRRRLLEATPEETEELESSACGCFII